MEKEFVDRIVEIEKVVGVSEEKVKEIQEQAERERQELLNKQREEREMLMKGVERTEEERQKLVRCRLSCRGDGGRNNGWNPRASLTVWGAP